MKCTPTKQCFSLRFFDQMDYRKISSKSWVAGLRFILKLEHTIAPEIWPISGDRANLLIIRLQKLWFLKSCSLDQAEIDYYYYYNFCFGVNNTARKIFHNVNLSFHAEIEHVHWFSPQGLYLKENLNNLKIINFLFYFWSSELFFSNVSK